MPPIHTCHVHMNTLLEEEKNMFARAKNSASLVSINIYIGHFAKKTLIIDKMV